MSIYDPMTIEQARQIVAWVSVANLLLVIVMVVQIIRWRQK